MADFSTIEKTNATWKHLFGILPTNNGIGADGKFWYEEKLPATHIIVPQDIWVDNIPYAYNISQAKAAAGLIVEDRSSSEGIVLTASGADWVVSASGIEPKVGFQIADTHPNPTYIKSIINVVNLGGNNYKITLNNNSGVSSGAAYLHGRIFLTEDLSSNGLAWFVKTIVGDNFSVGIENFVQPQRFGVGYSVRLFQANGTEITTTAGAWIFNWQKGLLLFAKNYTADDLGYVKPLYIEAFRYTGEFGQGTLPAGTTNFTLRYDGTNWVQNGTLLADGTDVFITNRLTISGSIVVPSGIAPINSNDLGTEGEIRYDSKFMYLYSSGKWRRSSLTLF